MAKEKSEKKSHKRSRESDVKAEETLDADISMAVTDVDVEDAPSPKKVKKEKEEIVINLDELSPIARPLAQRKLLKKLQKTIKKASKQRQVKRGVKEVVKGIRTGEKGLLVLAADITPIDIISHLPLLSEEGGVPYVFIPSKEELGRASSTKRPTSCVMICPNLKKRKRKDAEEKDDEKDDDYRELYEECFKEVEKLDSKVVF